MNWPLVLLVASLIILVPLAPLLFFKLSACMKGARATSWGNFQRWKTDHFDQRGRCRQHPDYNGSGAPRDLDCEACAVLQARPFSGCSE